MTSEAHYPHAPSSVAAARRFLRRELIDCPPPLRERAELMVSELATNAVKHARSGFSVVVDVDRELLRVDLRDYGGGRPTVQDPAPSESHGRGLLIVATLADNWGIEERPHGKSVWFELAVTAADLAGPAPVDRRPPAGA